MPVFGLGWHLALSYSLSYCPAPFSLCVCCHSIVGLCCVFVTGLCHCEIAVMVCVGRKGVWCLLSAVNSCVLWCVFQCGVCVVLSYLVVLWNGGCVGVCGLVACLPLLFVSFLPLPFPLCVGVRGSARAALRARTLSPNTIAFSLLCSLFSSSRAPPFFVLRLSCYCGMAVCDSPCVGVLCWHDCDG